MTAGLSAPDTGLPGVRKHPGNKNSPALKIPYSSVTVLVFPDFLGSPWLATGPPQRCAAELNNPFIQERSLGVPTTRVEMVSAVASSAYSMTSVSHWRPRRKSLRCPRNHWHEYFSLSLNPGFYRKSWPPLQEHLVLIFQRTFSSAPHHKYSKWTSWGLDASCPAPMSPGGRNRQAGAGGEHP